MSFKYDLKKYKNYLISHVERDPNITLRLGKGATPEEIKAMGFDTVICAIGAQPLIPPIPGVEGDNVIWAGDSFFAPERVGEKIVIIGGGQVGCETGVHYGSAGKQVTVLEMKDSLAPDAMRTYQEELEGQVQDHCTAVLCATVTEIEPDGVVYADAQGLSHKLPADTVILAAGMRALSAQAEEFRDCAPEFRAIGDCVKVGNVKTVTRAAYDAAMTIGY